MPNPNQETSPCSTTKAAMQPHAWNQTSILSQIGAGVLSIQKRLHGPFCGHLFGAPTTFEVALSIHRRKKRLHASACRRSPIPRGSPAAERPDAQRRRTSRNSPRARWNPSHAQALGSSPSPWVPNLDLEPRVRRAKLGSGGLGRGWVPLNNSKYIFFF